MYHSRIFYASVVALSNGSGADDQEIDYQLDYISMDMTATTQESSSKMKDLLKLPNVPLPKQGDLVEGIVLSKGKNEVLVDIDGVTCGLVRGEELYDESGQTENVKIGDKVIATVLDIENERGLMELSFKAAGHKQAWKNLHALYDAKETIAAQVTDANKGGLVVRVANSSGFLPVSQLSPENYPRIDGGDKQKILEHLRAFVGKEMPVRIIDLDEKENKIIVSERAAHEEKQKEILTKYAIGTLVKGKVTGVVAFGAFVEFDEGVEGLIHISELAWQRVEDPHDIIKVGDEVEAKIIDISGTKISLSLKALKDDPWEHVGEKYSAGQKVPGKVIKVNPFGLFVWYLDDGSYHSRDKSSRLHTNCFTYEEHLVMKEWFEQNFGISPAIHKFKDQEDKTIYYLSFPVSETRKLHDLFRDFEIPECMKYKLYYHHESHLPNSIPEAIVAYN